MPERYSMRICKNGDVITDCKEISSDNSKFCKDCGAAVIDECPKCNAPIPGSLPNVIAKTLPAPKFCNQCGSTYHWTTKKEMLGKVMEFVEDSDIKTEEKLELKEEIDKLSNNNLTEEEEVRFAEKMKSHAKGFGKKVYAEAREILIEVLSRTATNVLKGN